jgi:hypothetical protein
VIECLPSPESLIAEAARVSVRGGHLLLGHSDFDTMVFWRKPAGQTVCSPV